MGIAISTKQAYSEVDEFLNIISAENRNKVPQYLRELFNKEKDESYIKGIRPDIPINKQELKEETLAIIALLNLEYWCQDEIERQRLKEVYERNDERNKQYLQLDFNPEQVFKAKEIVTSNVPSVKNKESKFKKMLNKLKIWLFK